MTERERLIEILTETFDEQYDKRRLITPQHTADHLLANGVIVVDTDHVYVVKNRKPLRTAFNMPLDELAELVRAKQEGRLIVPPCKVGDMVYRPIISDTRKKPAIYCIVVTKIDMEIGSDGVNPYSFCIGKLKNTHCGDSFYFYDIGKTVFLTREEAEKALAERSNNAPNS